MVERVHLIDRSLFDRLMILIDDNYCHYHFVRFLCQYFDDYEDILIVTIHVDHYRQDMVVIDEQSVEQEHFVMVTVDIER